MWKGTYPVVIGGIFLAILLMSISPITDLDIWWHLATGRYIVESGHVPNSDIFSFTVPGRKWIDHEWLSQILFYQTFVGWGYTGPVLLKSTALLVAFLFLFFRSSIYLKKPTTVLTLLTVILLSKDAWLTRPMVFTFMFTSIFLYILDRRDRLRWALPLLTLLWVNLHGGFIIGLLLIMLHLFGSLFSRDYEEGRELSLIFISSALLSMINPYNYEMLVYPFQYAGNSIHASYIAEWQSPKFHAFSFFEALILLTFVSLSINKKINIADLLFIIVFTHLSLFAVRNVSLYALVCVPIILKYLESGFEDYNVRLPKFDLSLDMAIKKWGIPAFIYTGILLSFGLFFFNYFSNPHIFDTSPTKKFPAEAVEFIKEDRPPGALFNHYGWGGYCIWTLYPDYRVFIDGRIDMYGDFIYEYLKVHRVESGWEGTLKRYNVSLILIPSNSPVDVLLEDSPRWETLYRDEVSVIYSRVSPDRPLTSTN